MPRHPAGGQTDFTNQKGRFHKQKLIQLSNLLYKKHDTGRLCKIPVKQGGKIFLILYKRGENLTGVLPGLYRNMVDKTSIPR